MPCSSRTGQVVLCRYITAAGYLLFIVPASWVAKYDPSADGLVSVDGDWARGVLRVLTSRASLRICNIPGAAGHVWRSDLLAVPVAMHGIQVLCGQVLSLYVTFEAVSGLSRMNHRRGAVTQLGTLGGEEPPQAGWLFGTRCNVQ